MPFRIDKIKKNWGINNVGKRVKLNLIDNCKIGDYLLVQADVAIEKISARRAWDLSAVLQQ